MYRIHEFYLGFRRALKSLSYCTTGTILMQRMKIEIINLLLTYILYDQPFESRRRSVHSSVMYATGSMLQQ